MRWRSRAAEMPRSSPRAGRGCGSDRAMVRFEIALAQRQQIEVAGQHLGMTGPREDPSSPPPPSLPVVRPESPRPAAQARHWRWKYSIRDCSRRGGLRPFGIHPVGAGQSRDQHIHSIVYAPLFGNIMRIRHGFRSVQPETIQTPRAPWMSAVSFARVPHSAVILSMGSACPQPHQQDCPIFQHGFPRRRNMHRPARPERVGDREARRVPV